ncbi:Nectin-3-like protein [Oryzias melastigma]|uniref:Nectin-3-like protein n=1 Tax=Oryzias melastigma TaxID=30732 RepID=A0A834EZY0_ORYME|nr:Nectin-3-like protein [Oryzias melastigma]
MPGAAFGLFFLQLLVSVIQGLQNVNVIPGSTVEAVVGQNVSLPCILKEDHDLKIILSEWTKNGATKLALYSVDHGLHLFWTNVTVQIKKSSTNKILGTYQYLQNVKKWDSGNYNCKIAGFPLSSNISVTSLIVKDRPGHYTTHEPEKALCLPLTAPREVNGKSPENKTQQLQDNIDPTPP